MTNLSRSTALKIAAVLSFLISLFGIVFSLPLITQGADQVNNSAVSIPYGVLLLGLILGVIGIVAAYGTWKGQRWGIILTVLVNLINGLSAAPGILFAPSSSLFASAVMTVVVAIVVIVLCLWRERRMALA